MSYEPQGKTKPFIDAARAQPQRVWTSEEIAKMLEVPRANVGAWLTYPMRSGALHRGLRNNEVVYSVSPFPPEAAYPTVARRNGIERAEEDKELQIPKFGAFVPPKMSAPRPGSDARHVNPPGRPTPLSGELCEGCASAACLERGCVKRVPPPVVLAPAPTSAPTPAPTPAATNAPAPTAAPEIDPRFPAAHYGHDLLPVDGVVLVPEHEEPVVEEEPATEEEMQAEPKAFIDCSTGEIVLVDCPIDEDGRCTIPADLVMQIRKQIAWMPPR